MSTTAWQPARPAGASSARRCAAPTRAMRLAPQDGLYTLAVRGGAGERLRVVGSILSLLVAPEDPAALLDAMADPRDPHRHADGHRKGLSAQRRRRSRRRASGHRWPTSPIPAAPRTVHRLPGRSAGAPPRCGHAAFHRALLRQPSGQRRDAAPAAARSSPRLRDADLARFIEDEVAFPSSMVDRIVPATTDADRARISAGARRRGRLAGDDRAVPAMGGRGRFPGRPAGLGKVRRRRWCAT